MYSYSHKITIVAWMAVILAGAWLFISGPADCFADDAASGIKDFDRPPAFHSGEMDLENLEKRMYRAIGELHDFNDKAVVVGDVQYTLEPGTRITCSIGSFVGLRINEWGRVIACDPVRRPRPRGR